MPVEVQKFHLPPTRLIPNSPHPLMLYRNVFRSATSSTSTSTSSSTDTIAATFAALLARHGWAPQWIFRYGATQRAHYHSSTHECMAVLTGTATIRFGVADTSADPAESTVGGASEDGGLELEARPGDVFVIPAGVAHKTYDAKPAAGFKLLTPGGGRGIPEGTELGGIGLDGFTMMGAYPVVDDGDGRGGGVAAEWDFVERCEGGAAAYAEVWGTRHPGRDPVLGEKEEGIWGVWAGREQQAGDAGGGGGGGGGDGDEEAKGEEQREEGKKVPVGIAGDQ